jgi:hypothetical protein
MGLRVEQLPRVLDRSLYREAIDRYLERSYEYIEALYTFGSVRHPGLSDLDLLVVPKHRYLAPVHVRLAHRLEPRFDPIIEHDVFVLPDTHLQVAAFRNPRKFSLVYGPDVLQAVESDDSITTRLLGVIEGIHNRSVFLNQLRAAGVLQAQSCMRVFFGHQYTLQTGAELGLFEKNGYGEKMEDLRAQFLATRSEQCVLDVYHAFEASVTSSAHALKERLGLDVHSVAQVAATVQGRVALAFEGFEVERARKRAAIMSAYSQELARRNFWYGHMFVTRLLPPLAPSSALDRLVFRGVRSALRRGRRVLPSRGTATAVVRWASIALAAGIPA